MDYVTLSYKFFGNYTDSLKPLMIDLKEELQRANMNYTIDEYISIALATAAMTFFAETVLLSFIFAVIGFGIVPSMLLSFTLSIVLSGILFFLFYTYPTTSANSRENKIKKVLPFSVSYMATIASSNLPPIVMFNTLSKFKDFGEVAEEAKIITRDVENFGMTFSSAIKKQAKRTPSKEFRDLLWGINTIMASGADPPSYLKNKGNELMSDYRRRIRKYADNLSLFVEIYLTLIITGSIFFLVLTSIISTISGGGAGILLIQTFVVFILLPLLSIGFIILVKSMSPIEG